MTRGVFVALAMVASVGPWRQTPGAELAGCPAPRTVAAALRGMDLPHADWGALTPDAIRSGSRQLLNQVGYRDVPGGTYLLATFGRIINDESLCSTTFAIDYDTKTSRQWLSKVTVFHTSPLFQEARAAATRFYDIWRPPADVEAEEHGQDEWARAARRPGPTRTVTRWPASMGGCNTTLEMVREISRTASGWTMKVSLSPDSVCRTR